jgi:hypothetical protein
MANHSVLVPNAIAALNVSSKNRSAVYSADIDNGNLVVLSAKSTTAGEGEVWTALIPSTSNGLTGLWMVYEPEVVTTLSGSSEYKGLDPNPQNFYTIAGKVFSVFQPALGDLVTITAEGLAGTQSTNTFVNATDSTGGLKPVWGATQTASVFSMKLRGTTYISIADGSIGNQRVTALQFEVVGL